MKLSKKVIAAFSAAAALALAGTFVSCSEDDDDPEGAISGSGSNYTVNYTNSTDTIYRATNTTTFKHEGELVKITINNQTTSSHDGVMGFLWDLRQSKSAAVVEEVNGTTTATTKPAITDDGYQNFFALGFQNNQGTIRYYISKYFNVSNIQDDNFGAKKANNVNTHKEGIVKTDPAEIVVKEWTTIEGLSIAGDKTLTVWADIYPVFEKSTYGTDCGTYNTDEANFGGYVVDLYDKDPTDSSVTAKKVATSGIIKPEVTGYSKEPEQGTLAVYCNVQNGGKTLDGAWELKKDYAADEVVEE